MTPFEKLNTSLEQLQNGKTDLETHFALFWENAFLMKVDQIGEIMERTKAVGGNIVTLRGWSAFTEGFCYTYFPDRGDAYSKLSEALDLFREAEDLAGVGAAQCLLAVYFKNMGQLEQAQSHVQQALTNIGKNTTYKYFKGVGYYQAGEINHLLKDYDLAIRYFREGIEDIGPEFGGMHARIQNGIGTIYSDKGEYDKAYECFCNSLKLTEGQNNFLLDSKNYTDIGDYYFRIGDFDNALLFQKKSVQIRLDKKLNNPLVTNYIKLAELHLRLRNYDEALQFGLNAVQLAGEMKIIIKLYQAHHVVSAVYEAIGKTADALDHFKKYHQYKDEVHNQESARKIKQLSMHHEVENAQKEKEIFKLRNVELKSALDEIGASVRYARRIQEAILPPESFWKEHLPESFILYKPKDIVAGDFYWMETSGEHLLFAVADCTGHGVPGALVSVVCSTALNRAVKEFELTDPGKILGKVRELVLATFEKSENTVNDGMDISLCVLHRNSGELKFAGAHNSGWIIRQGTLIELPADKQPIGKTDHPKEFTTVSHSCKKGDTLYLFTDGYADQFGGSKGKKFMSRSLLRKLQDIVNLHPDMQSAELHSTFQEWKGNLEQVDDVCISGIRL